MHVVLVLHSGKDSFADTSPLDTCLAIKMYLQIRLLSSKRIIRCLECPDSSSVRGKSENPLHWIWFLYIHDIILEGCYNWLYKGQVAVLTILDGQNMMPKSNLLVYIYQVLFITFAHYLWRRVNRRRAYRLQRGPSTAIKECRGNMAFEIQFSIFAAIPMHPRLDATYCRYGHQTPE